MSAPVSSSVSLLQLGPLQFACFARHRSLGVHLSIYRRSQSEPVSEKQTADKLVSGIPSTPPIKESGGVESDSLASISVPRLHTAPGRLERPRAFVYRPKNKNKEGQRPIIRPLNHPRPPVCTVSLLRRAGSLPRARTSTAHFLAVSMHTCGLQHHTLMLLRLRCRGRFQGCHDCLPTRIL